MSSPQVTERIVRAILRSFVHAGIMPSYTDTAKIEAIPANYTDAQIDAVLGTITWNSYVPSSTDLLSGAGDVHVFIDSDNNDTIFNARYFRVAQDQSVPPVTSAVNEMLTIRRDIITGVIQGTTMTVGPRTVLGGGTHAARVMLGSDGAAAPYGSFTVGSTLVYGAAGMMVQGYPKLGLVGDEVRVYDPTGQTVRGGWSDTTASNKFHVGSFVTGDNLTIQAKSAGLPTVENYIFYTERSSGSYVKRFYFRGNDASVSTCMIVGGHEDETYGNPANLGNAAFAAVGGVLVVDSNVAYIYDRRTDRFLNSNVLTVASATPSTTIYNHIRCYTDGTPVFRVTSVGNCYTLGVFTQGSGDVAEYVVTDRDYAPGTVLITTAGRCTASSSTAQTNVVGVVSTAPGVEIGQDNIYDTVGAFLLSSTPFSVATQTVDVAGAFNFDTIGTHVWINRKVFVQIVNLEYDPDCGVTTITLDDTIEPSAVLYGGVRIASHYAKLAVCGVVPVRCSTENGDVTGNGDLLVSGPNGNAVLAPNPVTVGTVLGKAFSPLATIEDGVVEYGMVKTLVALQ